MLIKNVIIAHDFKNGYEFKKDINVQFVPDELVVKQIVYRHDGGETGIGKLNSDLIRGGTLCFFMDGSSQILNCSYSLGIPIDGTYTFTALELDNKPSVGSVGQLGLILQFIKH